MYVLLIFFFFEIGMWKKLFKGWTASFEVWSESERWTEERRTTSDPTRTLVGESTVV